MRALEPEVVDVIWAARCCRSRLFVTLAGHRPRIREPAVLLGDPGAAGDGLLMAVRGGAAGTGSCRTTLRSRRDEWVAAGVFELIAAEAIAAYDRIVGSISNVCVDGSTHKAPCGGEGTGKPR